MSIMRLGRAELRVLDLEESVNYYTNIIGLDEVGRSDGRVYLKAWDEFDHHSLFCRKRIRLVWIIWRLKLKKKMI